MVVFFFFNDTATTEIYTLSLHDALPICRYMGPDGAGHYVKMVHNGIEYGDIQLIYESYAILKDILEMDADRKSTRLNSSHSQISYAVFCLKKKKYNNTSASAAGQTY